MTTLHIYQSSFQITWIEAMNNMSVHQQPWYYKSQWVHMAWTVSFTWYICSKLAHIKIFQNFWVILVFYFLIISAGDKHLVIESKRHRMKTAPELTAKLNSFWQKTVLLSTGKNQLRSMGFRVCIVIKEPML